MAVRTVGPTPARTRKAEKQFVALLNKKRAGEALDIDDDVVADDVAEILQIRNGELDLDGDLQAIDAYVANARIVEQHKANVAKLPPESELRERLQFLENDFRQEWLRFAEAKEAVLNAMKDRQAVIDALKVAETTLATTLDSRDYLRGVAKEALQEANAR